MNSVRIDLTKRIEEATNYIEYIKKLEPVHIKVLQFLRKYIIINV